MPHICWIIINWTLGNNIKLNYNQNTKFSIHETTYKNIVCELQPFSSGGNELSHSSTAHQLGPSGCEMPYEYGASRHYGLSLYAFILVCCISCCFVAAIYQRRMGGLSIHTWLHFICTFEKRSYYAVLMSVPLSVHPSEFFRLFSTCCAKSIWNLV